MLYSDTRYMLRAISAEQRTLWDKFITTHPNGHLLQSWQWGQLKASSAWQPLRLALWDNKAQQIVAAAQILRRTAPYVPVRWAHLAYMPKGPVVDWSQATLCEAFFRQLYARLAREGALALRMELGQLAGSAEAELVQQRLTSLCVQPAQAIQPLRTIVLDLTPPEDLLLAQMKEKWRYNVRLAARKGVTVRVAQTLQDVQAWYSLLQTTGERDQFGIHTLDYYQRAWQLFAPLNQMRLLLAEHNGQLLAGIFVALFAQQASYLYGASSNEQRHLMPNYALQWAAIRWAKQQGAHLYDFWGIPETESEEEAMAGIYRFKRGWGGRVIQFLGCYEHVFQPLPIKVAQRFLRM